MKSDQVGPGFLGWAGFGLKFVKMFRADFGPAYTSFFYTIQSNDFFRSWSTFYLLTVVTSVSEVIVIFIQVILFPNTTALILFSIRISATHFFRRRQRRGN